MRDEHGESKQYMAVLKDDFEKVITSVREGRKRLVELFGECRTVAGFTYIPFHCKITYCRRTVSQLGYEPVGGSKEFCLSERVPIYKRFCFGGNYDIESDTCVHDEYKDCMVILRGLRNLGLRVLRGLNEGELVVSIPNEEIVKVEQAVQKSKTTSSA